MSNEIMPETSNLGKEFLQSHYNYNVEAIPFINKIIEEYVNNNMSFNVGETHMSLIQKVCSEGVEIDGVKRTLAVDNFFRLATGLEYSPMSMGTFEDMLEGFVKYKYAAV